MTPPATHLDDARLNDYADRLLSADDAHEVDAHVADCAACRAQLDDLLALLADSAAARHDVAAPPELWTGVAALTVHAPAVRRRVLRSLRVPLVAIALVLVAASSATTWWAATRRRPAPAPPGRVSPVWRPALEAMLREDEVAAKSMTIGLLSAPASDAEHLRGLLERLATVDAALRRAVADRDRGVPDAELARSLTNVLAERRAVLDEAGGRR